MLSESQPPPSTPQEIKLLGELWRIYHCAFYVFYDVGDSGFRLNGFASGVFLKYRDRYWIASAGHGLRDLSVVDWIISCGQRIPLRQNSDDPYFCVLADHEQVAREAESVGTGDIHYWVEPKKGGPIVADVGVLEVQNPDYIRSFGESDFLEVGRDRLALALPGTRTETWGECKEIITHNITRGRRNGQIRIASSVVDVAHPNENFYKLDYNVLNALEFDLSNGDIVEEIQREAATRNLDGVSGGPVWKVPSDPSNPLTTPELLGIHIATNRLVPPGKSTLQVAKLSYWMDLADKVIEEAAVTVPMKQ